MIDTEESMPIYLSIAKDNEGNRIDKKIVQYLVRDAKQQILRSYFDKNIIHIIIEKYIIDYVEYSYLPLNISCKKISIDMLVTYLKKHVPFYMIPKEFNFLKKFAFNKSGKIDRKNILKLY